VLGGERELRAASTTDQTPRGAVHRDWVDDRRH
jgi:hypothetical protein